MDSEERIYRDLQQHLDQQAVGFPATQSGVEMRILRRFFTPEEARLAMQIDYKPISVNEIYEKVKQTGMSSKDMQTMLDSMADKGALRHVERAGTHLYCTMPLVAGMAERYWDGQPNTEFYAEFGQYVGEGFGRAFLTKVPQIRTIPVEESVAADHYVTTYDNIRKIIEETEGTIGIVECMCRQGASSGGTPCKKTSRVETCMAFGDWAEAYLNKGIGRAISKTEALEIMRQNQADGLVLQPSNNQKVDFVCSCCGCCCAVLSILRRAPNPAALWATNYYAEVDTESCVGCKTCVDRCQMNAIKFDEENEVSGVDLDRCIGCGNCVTTCPSGALRLVKKEKETLPPTDYENLYDTIMARKKERVSG